MANPKGTTWEKGSQWLLRRNSDQKLIAQVWSDDGKQWTSKVMNLYAGYTVIRPKPFAEAIALAEAEVEKLWKGFLEVAVEKIDAAKY